MPSRAAYVPYLPPCFLPTNHSNLQTIAFRWTSGLFRKRHSVFKQARGEKSGWNLRVTRNLALFLPSTASFLQTLPPVEWMCRTIHCVSEHRVTTQLGAEDNEGGGLLNRFGSKNILMMLMLRQHARSMRYCFLQQTVTLLQVLLISVCIQQPVLPCMNAP